MNNVKILIVEDDDFVRQIVADTFLSEGAHIVTAPDGQTGVRLFLTHRPDLVVLDVELPYTDSWIAFRDILNKADMPIIFLATRKEDDQIVHGLTCSAIDFVVKPFRPQELIARAQATLL